MMFAQEREVLGLLSLQSLKSNFAPFGVLLSKYDKISGKWIISDASVTDFVL